MKPSTKKYYKDLKSAPKYSQRKSPPKNNKMDVAPKDEVKEMFLSWFAKRNTVGQIMSKQDVVQNILKKLDSKQDDALEEAMNELKSYGFIKVQEDGVTLVLTDKGSNFLK